MGVSLSQHMREALISVINAFNSTLAPETTSSKWTGAGYTGYYGRRVYFTIPLNDFVRKGGNVLTLSSMTIRLRSATGTGTTDYTFETDFSLIEFQVRSTGITTIVEFPSTLSVPNNSVVGLEVAFSATWDKEL